MNIEELRKKSIEQFAILRKKALNEAYLNTPIRSAAGASSSGGSVPSEPEPTEYNFDVTATDWAAVNVTNEASFIAFLESGGIGKDQNSFTGISVTDFSFVDGRIRCNLTATTDDNFFLSGIGVTHILGLGNTTYNRLDVTNNSIIVFDPILSNACEQLDITNNLLSTFNPTRPLPSSLIYLDISNNQLTDFDPEISLPNGLEQLRLSNNLITVFDPTLPLPNSLDALYLTNNQLTFFNPSAEWPNSITNTFLNDNDITTEGYTISEQWANAQEFASPRSINFNGNTNSTVGTVFRSILQSKGYTVAG